MSREWKSVIEYTCKVNPHFLSNDNWYKDYIRIFIGQLAYDEIIYTSLKYPNAGNKVRTLTRDVVLDMILEYEETYIGDYTEYENIGLRVRDIEDEELKEFLVGEVLNVYAEHLCK